MTLPFHHCEHCFCRSSPLAAFPLSWSDPEKHTTLHQPVQTIELFGKDEPELSVTCSDISEILLNRSLKHKIKKRFR